MTGESVPPSGVLTGGNAQELVLGSHRNTTGGHRTNSGPHLPPRGDPRSASQPLEVETSVDPLSQGFDKIMARFDKLEFHLESTDCRVDNLEAPASPDPDPPFYSDDPAYEGYRSRRDTWGIEQETIPRYFNHGPRDRGGDGCPLRRDTWNTRDRVGRSTHRSSAYEPCRARTPPRRRSSWDRPFDRYHQEGDREFQGYRQPTCWDSPHQRSQFPPPDLISSAIYT